MAYMVNVAQELTNRHFNIVSGLCSSQNITELIKFMTFSKRQGHIVYGISVVNCDMESDYKKYSQLIAKSFSAIEGKKIFLTVFISSAPDEVLIEYSENDIDDYNADFVEAKWIVDVSKKDIVVKGGQPSEILNIREALIAGFGETQSISVNTEELELYSAKYDASKMKCTKPYITYILFVINTVFWLIMYTKTGEEIIYKMALDKQMVTKGEIYRLFTYMFTHGGFEHYLCNNFSLLILGSRVEKYAGHIKFLVIYILSGIIAGCTSFIVMPYGLAVGASGAIFGIVGLLIYLAFKLKHSIGGFDFYIAVIYAIVGAASGFMIANVDNFAHIGGLIGGIVLSALIRAEK